MLNLQSLVIKRNLSINQMGGGEAVTHSNQFVSFFHHYGPIPTRDNMYDELIESEIDRHGFDLVIHIETARLVDILNNFESKNPNSIILTGVGGRWKIYLYRKVWEFF